MTISALRRISMCALTFGIAACGAGDRSAPSLPSSPETVRAAPVVAPVSSPVAMPVTSQGTKPPGFDSIFHVDPKPDVQGIVHGDSPLTVEFDLCDSKSDGSKTLSYLFDWDFDHVADVVGTGDACLQKHKYDVRKFPDAKGHVLFKTNLCVVSGDPRSNGPGTYFSCQSFKVDLPVPRVAQCKSKAGACNNNSQCCSGNTCDGSTCFPSGCAHSFCATGGVLSSGCDSCVASICGVDPFCCNNSWDSICVDEVSSVCGLTCGF